MKTKVALTVWIFTGSVYLATYLVKTFINWQFNNPFQWIIDIPTYTQEERGLGLFAYVCFQGVSIFVIYQLHTEAAEKKKKEQDENLR